VTEPDVTLTDVGLAIECGIFALLIARRWPSATPLSFWFAVFFASIGVAALAGAAVHGRFLPDSTSALWLVPLVALGVTALAAWRITAALLDETMTASWLARLAAIDFVVYCGVVLFVTRSFTIAIVNYVPALTVLFILFVRESRRHRAAGPRWGATALALMFVGSIVQFQRVAVHPVYFNHNALYHAIEAITLLFMFGASRWAIATRARTWGAHADTT
jgi:hypothetical protein